MGTFWHKPAYTRADRDADGEIRADALRPGIYCEDEAALAQLRRGARTRSRTMIATPFGWSMEGVAVYLCTPEQAAMFRATATVTSEESLAEQRAQADFADEAWRATIARAAEVLLADTYGPGVYGPDGKVEVMARDVRPPARKVLEELALMMGEMTAQDMAEERTKATRAVVREALRGMNGEEFGRRFMRHAPAGANRKARRAAAAQARRGA